METKTCCYSSFELLPDEMILNIYQYLRGADILYSFYHLNKRLNRTVRDYCYDINLMNLSHRQFSFCVSTILPSISSMIRTFVLNANWETIISQQLFSILFQTRLCFLCPNLENLVLRWFTCDRVMSLMSNLDDCEHLTKLNIQYLRGESNSSFMNRIFSANNQRLSTIRFDEDSTDLSLPDEDDRKIYSNIEDLSVNFNQGEQLFHLLPLIPHIRRLSVSIEEWSDGRKMKSSLSNVSFLPQLKIFQLRSFNLFWLYDDIATILKSMPILERFALDIRTNDERLIKEDQWIRILPKTLNQFDFFIRYYSFEDASDLKTYQYCQSKRFPAVCLTDEPRHRFILHTIPCRLRSMIIPTSLAKEMLTGWTYLQTVQDLCISDASHVHDVLLILQHFRRIRTLTITTNEKCQILTPLTESQSVPLYLPCLKQIDLSGSFILYPLLNAAVNLDYLIIPFDILKRLLDDPLTCDLLQRRIVRLSISNWDDLQSDILPRLADVFRSLRHLVITLKDSTLIIDNFILNLLSLWKQNQRLSLDVKGQLSNDVKKNLQTWITSQSHLTMNDDFAMECTEKWFDLWH